MFTNIVVVFLVFSLWSTTSLIIQRGDYLGHISVVQVDHDAAHN